MEIYKNWLLILRKEGSEYKLVAEVQEGILNVLDLSVSAIRGSQNGIFVHVRDLETEKGVLSGIGCYGWMDYEEGVKLLYPEAFKTIPESLWNYDWNYFSSSGYEKNKASWGFLFRELPNDVFESLPQGVRYHELGSNNAKFEFVGDLDLPYIGVKKETFSEFYSWLKVIDPELSEKIKFEDALRFNQGFAYFSKCYGIEVPASGLDE